jgi:hypothetical protein
MKKYLSLFLVTSILTGSVQANAFKSPDILVDSKLDFDWSGVLISKARRLLSNYKMDDPFTSKILDPIVVNESTFNNFLPEESLQLVNDLGHMIGMDILKGKTKITLQGLSYDIKGFRTDLKATEEHADGVVIASDFSANELNLTAEKVSLELSIPSKDPNNTATIKIDILNPVVKARGDKITKFFAKVKIQEKKDTFKLVIQSSDFDHMSDELLRDPSQIQIELGKVLVPNVKMTIGSKKVELQQEKIQNLLESKKEGLTGLLIAQFAALLKKGVGETVLKAIEKYEFDREYWLDSDIIKSQIKISDFASNLNRNNIEVNLPGDFCTKDKFTQLNKECINSKVTQASKSRLDKDLHEESMLHMKSLIDNGDANIVASISEDYVNKLLVTTYDAGLWKTMLDEAGVELGDEKVFIRLNDKGDTGTLYMDVKYKFSKFQGFVLGQKVIRFPLVLKVSIRVEKHEGSPVMIIRLNDVDTSDDTLIKGFPDLNLRSTVQDVPRLKKKVVKEIRSKMQPMIGKDVMDLRYPELKGLGLESVNFLSDGNGRMNAVMKLEDLIKEQD